VSLAYVAGQILLASDLNARNPITTRMTGTQALTASSTALQNITEMVVSLLAGRTYSIVCNVGAFCSSAVPDIKLDWVVTGGVALLDGRASRGPSVNSTDVQATAAAAVTVGVLRSSGNALLTNAITYGVDASGAVGQIEEAFTVTTTTAGTLQLRAAQNTSNATVVTVFPGYIIATPIS
jgi:hypothetical protein